MTVDAVALLDQASLRQVLARARPLSATVSEGSDLMEHPLENGARVVDHVVRRPTEITLALMLPSVEVFEELRGLYQNTTVLTVQVRAATYRDMVLAEIPHEESAEMVGSLPLTLRFRQIILAGTQGAEPRNPLQGATAKRGLQQTTAASAQQEARAAPAFRKGA